MNFIRPIIVKAIATRFAIHMAVSKKSRSVRQAILVYLLHLTFLPLAMAESPKVGIQNRVAWTKSQIKGTPDPPLPYVTSRAFPSLKFNQCLDITNAAGTDRLFIVEQSGKIFSFPSRPDVEAADLVIDIAKEIPGAEQVYSLAFHPDFERNRYCYVCYIKAPKLDDGTRVARFTMTDTNPPMIDVSSEKTIITWLSGGHNGCCLKFGPDGYLYISAGDGEGPNPPDIRQTGQDVTDLLSSILRIDVDSTENGRNYSIPPDNPFVDLATARDEIWAYGFRNPWRMSFDRKTGDLWVGDVGWELWELLDRVQRGGNYGWAVTEGRQPTNTEWPRGPSPILPPTIDHPHSESSSITDGLTYYGRRLPEIHGMHIYGDYDTGKFWGFRYEDGQVVDHLELADTTHRVVGFGEDNDGEMYVLDHTAGTIHSLVRNPDQNQASSFPRKLSESGLFLSVAKALPSAGVIPYSINAEPWADHATAERLVAVPDKLSVTAEGQVWSFPENSVLVKTLSLEMERGNPNSRRRIETQILHLDGTEWQPYTYQWNDEQSDAVLLNADGGERSFDILDPRAPGGTSKQTWRFSGRAECQRCHNKWSGPALGFNAPQLNKYHDYDGIVASQLDTFAHIRLLAKPLADDSLPRLVDPHDPSADQDHRARAYLHSNCAHCHRLHAGSSVLSKMRYDLPLEKTDMVGVRPTQGTFGIHAAQVVAPGDPFRSVLLYRMSKLGGGRMPHIGSTDVDLEGVRLIHDWIREMPQGHSRDTVGEEVATKLRAKEVASLQRLCAVQQASPKQSELVEQLLSSTSGALMLLRSIDDGKLDERATALIADQAMHRDDVSVRDLFERFLPDEQRIKRLGSVAQASQILSLPGDLAHGKQLFFNTASVQCKNCHRIGVAGNEVGPDLTTIGRKYNRAQLLESILEPSKLIDPKYVTYLAETGDGRLLTGLLVIKDGQEVVLKDAQNQVIRIAPEQIEQLVPQKLSLMPDLLLRDMTAQQTADLLAYLSSLK